MSTTELTWIELRKKLVSFISSRTKDREIAEDIAHEVFLKVHDKWKQLRDGALLEPWVFRIARNAMMDHFRNGKRHNVKYVPEERPEAPLTDFSACVSGCLQDEVKNLPEHYQQALMLAEIQNMPQVELADKLNLSYSGVKSRVQRARTMLKERLNRKYRIEADVYGNVITCENRSTSPCSTQSKEMKSEG